MNHAFGRPRKPRRPHINITSLIDVMFLLLIFFMVSSVFRDSAGIDITLPSAATATEQQEAAYEIFIEESGAITFRNAPMELEELETQLRQLLKEEPDARVTLSADGGSNTERFVAVIDLARKIGGKQLIIRTQPSNEAANE